MKRGSRAWKKQGKQRWKWRKKKPEGVRRPGRGQSSDGSIASNHQCVGLFPLLLRESMKALAVLGVLILASVSLGGCIGEGETEDQSRFIDDESELFDPESPDYCGDFDGDGEPDCPLSGYIPETDPGVQPTASAGTTWTLRTRGSRKGCFLRNCARN